MFFLIIVSLVLIALLTFIAITAKNTKELFEGISKAVLLILLLSIVANISLAQNYTQSLIPGANDGIGISNVLAKVIITDDGWGESGLKNYF